MLFVLISVSFFSVYLVVVAVFFFIIIIVNFKIHFPFIYIIALEFVPV